MILIRTMKNEDIPVILRAWSEFLPHEPASKANIFRKLFLDVNFQKEGLFIVEKDGEIAGFCNSVYRTVAPVQGAATTEDTGYVNVLAIRRDEDFSETGNLLLAAAENRLKNCGKTGISTAYAPVYFVQGVDAELAADYVKLYRERGYREDASITMDIELTNFLPQEKYLERQKALEKEGYYFGPLTEELLLAAIDPKEPFIGTGWSYEFRARLFADLDFERMRICAKDGHVIGACIFSDPCSSPERFGPFGVNSSEQGKGIGSVLLNDCLTEMKRRGLHNAWMQWVGEGGTADRMYRRFGFHKSHNYLMFSKELQ